MRRQLEAEPLLGDMLLFLVRSSRNRAVDFYLFPRIRAFSGH